MLKRQAHEISLAIPQLTRGFSALVACFLLAALVTADEPKPRIVFDSVRLWDCVKKATQTGKGD